MVKGKYHVKIHVEQEMREAVFHLIQREAVQCPTGAHILLARDCDYLRVK